jgi:hypothetical protein
MRLGAKPLLAPLPPPFASAPKLFCCTSCIPTVFAPPAFEAALTPDATLQATLSAVSICTSVLVKQVN